MKTTILALFLLLCSAGLVGATQASTVVVSIKPLHSLVAGVMQGVAEPMLLVKGGGSPHGYSLRPSEARALAAADLVVWGGPQLEAFLVKPLVTLAHQAHQLELLEAIEGPLLALRGGGSWEGHAHGHEEEKHGHDTEGHERADSVNTHFWLSPLLARQVVSHTAQTLSELDPENQSRYAQNAARLLERLEELHLKLQQKLAPVKNVPYVVFHDAYQYFEDSYGLNVVGSITLDADRSPGAKRIIEIREKIVSLGARAVFSEPQFEARLVDTVIAGTDARTGVLDPLGSELPAGPESYFQLLNNLAESLRAGLLD
jgi:zinc transport system substrate-binding protein